MNKILLTLCIILMGTACKKDNPNPEALPPATQSGKNTFGCYVNGKIWVPYSPNYFDRNITPVFGNAWSLMALRNLKGDGSDTQSFKIIVLLDWDNPVQTYLLNSGAAVIHRENNNPCVYHSDDLHVFTEGKVTVTKVDLEEKVWAGTFEFTLGAEGCETIKVTEGRFDIKIP